MKASVNPYRLQFKRPGGTSRGVLTHKDTWFLILNDQGRQGVGECGMFRGLSQDDVPEFESKLNWTANHIDQDFETLYESLSEFPAIQFGLEMAIRSFSSPDPFELYSSEFTRGSGSIPINGLIWMGDPDFMKSQIAKRIEDGFDCIKMKIGAIDFEVEYNILRTLRETYAEKDIQIRVDANGAFSPQGALEKLKRLSALQIHSIEQPIAAGQHDSMAQLCQDSPLPIALDEELIGISEKHEKQQLLEELRPHYIILKPSLIGGYRKSEEWIELSNQLDVGWWVTSALESNIGLNAIAQWVFELKSEMHQGLGTGSLFTNNIDSPLIVKNGTLRYQPENNWNFNLSDR